MAQAARLNLRMQKELKLLLSDPPPGASFPLLSGESSSSSLSTIHAQILGPEGTVYERGVFSVTIQIPERYPFQPPGVTFATPIYHPNIDTGGRICLDILNLPPKGTWQPSLNISTVLTSIGLLLSEPNPDDGLMCEASKEYKYNRQAFDQKAHSMTEKYAKAGLHGNGIETSLIFPKSSKMEAEGSNLNLKREVTEHIASHNKAGRISPKLSLESLGSTQKRDCIVRTNEVPNKLQNSTDMHNLNREKLPGAKQQKLSLSSLCYSKARDNDIQNNAVDNLSLANPQSVSIASSGFSVNLSDGFSDNNGLLPSKDASATTVIDLNKSNCKKLCSVRKKLSLGLSGSSDVLEYNQKENIRPLTLLRGDSNDKCQLLQRPRNESNVQRKTLLPLSPDHTPNKQLLSNVGPDDKIASHSTKQGAELTDELPMLDAIIVLDSEDSEEDSAPSMSKLLVARKRLARKRKPTCKIEELRNLSS